MMHYHTNKKIVNKIRVLWWIFLETISSAKGEERAASADCKLFIARACDKLIYQLLECSAPFQSLFGVRLYFGPLAIA
jgi:hypothetical protein